MAKRRYKRDCAYAIRDKEAGTLTSFRIFGWNGEAHDAIKFLHDLLDKTEDEAAAIVNATDFSCESVKITIEHENTQKKDEQIQSLTSTKRLL